MPGTDRSAMLARMSRLFLRAWMLALGLLASALPAQVRILPLGDSITESMANYASYRYFLWKQIDAANQCADFVGTRFGVSQGEPLFADFDQEHSGYSGYPIAWLEMLVASGALVLPEADVALIHLGTNDIVLPFLIGRRPNLDAAFLSLQNLVSALRAKNPRIKILVAKILPIGRSSTVAAAAPWALPAGTFVMAWNSGYLPRILQLGTADSPIAIVDQNSWVVPSLHLQDPVHPNDLGNQVIADQWYQAMQNQGWLSTGTPCLSVLSPGCVANGSRDDAPQLRVVGNQQPQPGSPLVFEVANVPATSQIAALIIGATEAPSPLPWNGCPVHPSIDVLLLSNVPSAAPGTTASFPLQIPLATPLGQHFYVQAITYGPQSIDLATSNGLQVLVY